jgi:hypothetical protein
VLTLCNATVQNWSLSVGIHRKPAILRVAGLLWNLAYPSNFLIEKGYKYNKV